jgi:hypothetical protein
MENLFRLLPVSMLFLLLVCLAPLRADDSQRPITERFDRGSVEEVPSFQRHVVPMLGRLGCNGRACHGSFQGRGGFRLSLFGYDFQADHDALLDAESPRINLDDVSESLVLVKPTDEDNHEGGKRYDLAGWEYRVLSNWIAAGAPFDGSTMDQLVKLEVSPGEIIFKSDGQRSQVTVVAVWEDGSREDVTPLCRFKSNDDLIADIDRDGMVTAGGAGDTFVVVSYDRAVVPVVVMQPVSKRVGKKYPKVPTPTRVDELVVEKLRKLGIVPSELCTDEQFLRRLRLDLTGTLPMAKEIEAFLADKSPRKRSRKIDELLETPAYAAWWTQKLCDFTGNNDQQLNNVAPVRGRASQEWFDWIYKRVDQNVAYDELVAGIVTATSRPPGMSYREYCEMMSDIYRPGSDKSFADLESLPHYWARRDFRQPAERAISFAYAFMGVRIQCAQCHKHPFDQWSKQDFADFSRFFSGVVASSQAPRAEMDEYQKIVKELGLQGKKGGQLRRELPALLKAGKTIPFPEVYITSPRLPRKAGQSRGTDPVSSARLLGDEEISWQQGEDIRQPLMEWLRRDDNKYFARAFVNRAWASYFHVGIVNPPDDMSLANPPSNKALLDYLAEQFVANDFDMKWLHREIANSRTYQLSWQSNETNKLDQHNFSHAIPRRLPAEVIYDAMVQATASDQRVAQLQQSNRERAIAMAIASQRAQQRGTGMSYAMMVFGRSTRESNCDCDRSDDPTLLQTVYLQNDRDLHTMLDRRGDGWLDQLARQYKLTMGGQSVVRGPRPSNYDQRVKQLKQQIVRLRETNRGEQAKRVAAALAAFKNRFGESAEQADNATDTGFDTKQVVTQAFLRTLSRYPSEHELQRSMEFVDEDTDKINGVRGLVWALLNTKEFIVNH